MRSSATTPFTIRAARRRGHCRNQGKRHKTHKANLFIAFPLPLVVSTSSFVLWKRGCRRVNKRIAHPSLALHSASSDSRTHRYSPTLLLSNDAAHLSSRWTKATNVRPAHDRDAAAPPRAARPTPKKLHIAGGGVRIGTLASSSVWAMFTGHSPPPQFRRRQSAVLSRPCHRSKG